MTGGTGVHTPQLPTFLATLTLRGAQWDRAPAAHSGNWLTQAPFMPHLHTLCVSRDHLPMNHSNRSLVSASTDGEAGVGAGGKTGPHPPCSGCVSSRPVIPHMGPLSSQGVSCPEPSASVVSWRAGTRSARPVDDGPGGCTAGFPEAQNSDQEEGALRLEQHWGWDACSPLFSPSWPGRAVLAMAGSEKGKKCAPSPCRTSCPTRCPGATAQPGGHCIPSPVRAETITARMQGASH